MRKIKEYLRKKYIYLRYALQFNRVENMSLVEAKYLLDEFRPQKPPKFEQDVSYNPIYDLMIIVPVYNAASFLDDCINSLLGQDTKYSYGVIFIDDGSTDESGVILDRYSVLKNVEVIHKKNSGIAGARNYGLKNIHGRYIMFVDSDDLLPDNAVELLLDVALKQDADIVEGGHKEFSYNEAVDIHASSKSSLDLTELNGYPWGKVIVAEKMFDLCFPEGYEYEDTIISTLLIPNCKVVSVIPHIVYYYRQNANGITATGVNKKESVDTLYMTYYCMEEALKRGNKIYLDDFLNQVRLNWMRTQNMPKSIRKAIFIVESKMLDKYFAEVKNYEKGALCTIEKVLRRRSFYAYEWLMNNWYLWELKG